MCAHACGLELSMAAKASHATICCGVIWLWGCLHLQALGFWGVLTSPILPVRLTSPRPPAESKPALRPRLLGNTAGAHWPSRHLLAVSSANAQAASGAACNPAFPLVEAKISGVHAAFLAGTLNCSQLVAVWTVHAAHSLWRCQLSNRFWVSGLTASCVLLQAYADRIAAFDKAFTASIINSEHQTHHVMPAMQPHCIQVPAS